MAGADRFMKISKSIPLQMAATISINPTTAYRMLKDFINLKSGTRSFSFMLHSHDHADPNLGKLSHLRALSRHT